MPAERLTKSYLERRFPAELREANRSQGRDSTYLPTRDWFRNHTHCFTVDFSLRGLSRAIKRHFGEEITLNQFLRHHDFERGHRGKGLPGEHVETHRLITEYLETLSERKGRAEGTTETARAALKKNLRFHVLVAGDGDLIDTARYDTRRERVKMIERVAAIFDRLDGELSDGAADNYSRYLKEFYDYVQRHAVVEFNPADEALNDFDWTSSSSTSKSLSAPQIKRLWYATGEYRPRKEFVMKGFVAIFAAAGTRTAEPVEKLDLIEDFHLEDPPHVDFGPDRKNGPEDAAIMTGVEFLKEYRDHLKSREDWNGAPIPKPSDFSKSISSNTLRNWTEALARKAGVTLDDGSLPTPKNIRKFWFTHYKKAVRRERVQTRIVAHEQGTSTLRVAEDAYIEDEELLRGIRDKARGHFENVFPDDAIEQTPYLPTEDDDLGEGAGTYVLSDFINSPKTVGPAGLTMYAATTCVTMTQDRVMLELESLSPPEAEYPYVDPVRVSITAVLTILMAILLVVTVPPIGSLIAH